MEAYKVKLPIVGYLCIEVEADDKDSAIDKALDEATIDHIESWDALLHLHRGKVSYRQYPQEEEVTLVTENRPHPA